MRYRVPFKFSSRVQSHKPLAPPKKTHLISMFLSMSTSLGPVGDAATGYCSLAGPSQYLLRAKCTGDAGRRVKALYM